jgi:hypothetical protein
MEVSRFDVFLVKLDPARGSEIKKTRPCLVISPDEMNRHIRTAQQRGDPIPQELYVDSRANRGRLCWTKYEQ